MAMPLRTLSATAGDQVLVVAAVLGQLDLHAEVVGAQASLFVPLRASAGVAISMARSFLNLGWL